MSINSGISFYTEEHDFSLGQPEKVRDWLMRLATIHNREIDTLNYIFCSDDYLLGLNREYLAHDYYTDILTFPYQETPIVSDIYISLDRVRDNAKAFGVEVDRELYRVMAHGLLHLLGLDDHSEEDIRKMRAAEEEALAMIEQ